MVEGVQADLVPLVDHAFDQVRVAGGHGAGDEEDGVRVVFLQDVEDLRGPLRVGAVVEGEDEPVLGHAHAGLAPAAGVDDGTALEDLLGHVIGGGGRLDAVVGEDLAVHVPAEHEHREQGDKEQRRQQIAHRQAATRRPAVAAWAGGHLQDAAFRGRGR